MTENIDELPILPPNKDYSNTDASESTRLLEPNLPVIYKVAVTPSSPTSNKISSNDSYQGTAGTSQGSSRTRLLDPTLTPVDPHTGNTYRLKR